MISAVGNFRSIVSRLFGKAFDQWRLFAAGEVRCSGLIYRAKYRSIARSQDLFLGDMWLGGRRTGANLHWSISGQ